ncbi:aldo/keto reductase [Aliiglaciecola sp. 3_MG-2023]|uniref:aldo/keto reductase n=1 Tax=Aliiglaciecola sp. 3_MG-2023 TaxID=3062644 RepID=UPI0026E32384|nr:aldo/keto reductase [Aliiglaciecola sp. 3_MG-2023]MDO6693120.1 aldo/keto reductase [Aliiglaciecola sp. 3_MG-2023]
MSNKPVIAKKQIGTTQLQIDTLGFGCAPMGNLYQAISDEDAKSILTAAWQAGFRHFDTAPHYGQGLSERRTGDMLRPLQGKDYILSTKVGRLLKPAGYAHTRHGFVSPMPFDIHYDYSYDGIMRSFEDSIQRLGIDRIDILYMHDIGRDTHGDANDKHFPIAMQGGYKAMNELRSQGLVKAIGLGVNEYQVCEQALDYGDWDCFLLAGRYSLLEQQSLQTFLPKCEQQNCSIIIGGPYNSGILATGVNGTNTPYYNYAPASPAIIDRVAKIEDICQQYDVTLAAAALQFPLAHPAVASVIPGLGNISRIQKTIELFQQTIPSEFWQSLQQAGLLDENAPIPKQ